MRRTKQSERKPCWSARVRAAEGGHLHPADVQASVDTRDVWNRRGGARIPRQRLGQGPAFGTSKGEMASKLNDPCVSCGRLCRDQFAKQNGEKPLNNS